MLNIIRTMILYSVVVVIIVVIELGQGLAAKARGEEGTADRDTAASNRSTGNRLSNSARG